MASEQDDHKPQNAEAPSVASRDLSPAARRALAEAQARRARAAAPHAPPSEQGGPAGPEPTRFGDWERNGIASDF